LSVAIIINPIAGGARADRARLRAERASKAVQRHGDSCEIFLTERRGHAREIARAAAQRGVRLVLTWGGDGTINEVVSALAFGPVPIGMIPSGSGNGLARELGVSSVPEQAIADALAAEPRRMDIGDIDGHYFANLAGIGFDAFVAAQFDLPGNRRGFLNYCRIAARGLMTYAPARYVITANGERVDSRAVLVTIANSAQFGNGARIAPGARVDDGKLNLVVVSERARWQTLAHLPRLFTGSVGRMPGYSVRCVERVLIDCECPMTYHVDGEPYQGGSSLRARVHPGALLVAVK
jgi:YegS/Rv2252/BmrU family lipid kinase